MELFIYILIALLIILWLALIFLVVIAVELYKMFNI